MNTPDSSRPPRDDSDPRAPLLRAPERSPYQCVLCGTPASYSGYANAYGEKVCPLCIQEAIAEAEAWHLTARLHTFMGCPSSTCEICEIVRG